MPTQQEQLDYLLKEVNKLKDAGCGCTDCQETEETVAPYKIYRALFTQSGSSVPTVEVLENTFEGELTWTRQGTGNYSLISSEGEFTEDRTSMPKIIEHVGLERWIAGRRVSDTNFQIITYSNSVFSDGINNTDGFPTLIDIKVYPLIPETLILDL